MSIRIKSIIAETGSFQHGLITTASYATVAQNVLGSITSASYALTASYALSAPVGGNPDWSNVQNKPVGLVSSSIQINTGSFTGSFTGALQGTISSASYALTASYAANSSNNSVTSSYISGTAWQDGGTYNVPEVQIISASYALTASYATIAQNVLGSITSASYAGTDWIAINNKPIGLVSSSVQINTGSFTGSFTGAFQGLGVGITGVVSASYAGTDWVAINNKPTIVSASSQISYTGITNISVGILSSSTQLNLLTNVSASWASTSLSASYAGTDWIAINNKPVGLLSSSIQINTGSYTGSFTGAFQGLGSGITGIVSASYAGTDWSVINNKPVLFSSSIQTSTGSFTGSFTGALQGTISSASYALTSSAATSITFIPTSASYAGTDWFVVNNKPAGLVSSSVQINTGSFTGSVTGAFQGIGSGITGIISASYAGTDWLAINNKSVGLVSSSAQVNTGSFTGSFTGAFQGIGSGITGVISASYALTSSAATSITFVPVSASYANTDWVAINNKPTVFSSSAQINTGSYTGSVTGAFQGLGAGITGVVSASYALTSSFVNNNYNSLVFGMEQSGAILNTGYRGSTRIPKQSQLISVYLLAKQSGSVHVDVRKNTYAAWAPSQINGTSITGSTLLSMSNAVKYQDTTLTGWTTIFNEDDILSFYINTVSGTVNFNALSIGMKLRAL